MTDMDGSYPRQPGRHDILPFKPDDGTPADPDLSVAGTDVDLTDGENPDTSAEEDE